MTVGSSLHLFVDLVNSFPLESEPSHFQTLFFLTQTRPNYGDKNTRVLNLLFSKKKMFTLFQSLVNFSSLFKASETILLEKALFFPLNSLIWSCSLRCTVLVDKMVQPVKEFATQAWPPEFNPRTHKETSGSQMLSFERHTCTIGICTPGTK